MRVVFLPGLDGTGLLFEPLLQVLPEHIQHSVIRYPLDKKQTYSELLEYVLQRLPVDEPYILVGESFSGPLAYQVALRKPANLVCVVFVATFLQNPRPFLLRIACLFPLSVMFHLPVSRWLLRWSMCGMEMSEQLVEKFRQAIRMVSPAVLAFRLQEVKRLRSDKECLAVSSVYIRAMQDRLVPASCSQGFCQHSNDIQVFHVLGPHAILQASPQPCADIIEGLTGQ